MVKCKECGFLSVGSGEGDSPPPTPGYRQTGRRTGGDSNPTPHCLLLAQNLEGEFTRQQTPGQTAADSHGVALTVISTERQCDSYFPWHPGFTPKEHIQMQLAAQLKQEIEDRRIADEERGERRLREDKERDDARREADRVWQAKQEDIRFRRSVILGVGLAVLAGILTLLAEPWKGKPEPLPPNVPVAIPAEAFKK